MSLRQCVLAAVLVIFGLSSVIAEQPVRRKAGNRTPTRKATVLTGVVDQIGDKFVLAGEESIRPHAILRADGFSPDNFARFVGHRVQIRGRLVIEQGEQILVVKSVSDVKNIEPESPGR